MKETLCANCGLTACDPRCPDAPVEETILFCDKCGDGILEGELYWALPGGCLCGSCIDEMSAADLIEYTDIGSVMMATKEVMWDE